MLENMIVQTKYRTIYMNMLVVVLLETCVILLIQLKQINWSVCSIMV